MHCVLFPKLRIAGDIDHVLSSGYPEVHLLLLYRLVVDASARTHVRMHAHTYIKQRLCCIKR